MEGKVLTCTCNSEFQDREYGRGNRVHNPMTKGSGHSLQFLGFRCTVCGKQKSATAEEKRSAKETK